MTPALAYISCRRARTLSAFVVELILFGAVCPAWAQSPDRLFSDAVAAYQRGRFDSAAAGFLALVQSGIDDARVWYDLGNAQFKSGSIGSALVAYRRGLRLTPRDADLRANYRYVRLFAADKIEPVGVLFLERWWLAAVGRLSIYEARALAGISFWAAVLLTAWSLWPKRRPGKAIPVGALVVCWCLWLLLTGVAATAYVRDVSRHDGAVIAVKTDIRGGPGNDYALQFVAHDGLEGTVERSESGWYLVRFPNGVKGWVAATAFEIV
ncbi:MAG: hypothetical protein AB1792_01260 [Candidatus Zixiibacteriota bacterium]